MNAARPADNKSAMSQIVPMYLLVRVKLSGMKMTEAGLVR